MIAKRKTKTKRSREFLKALRLVQKEVGRLKRDWYAFRYLSLQNGNSFMAGTYFDQITAANQILDVIRSLK